jgi:cathepsin F
MNKFLFVLLFVFCSCEAELDSIVFHQFQKFIKKYNKKYESVNEYLARYEVFKRNMIESFTNENKSYQTGITKFSDLTKQEFTKIYLNLNYDAMAMANFDPYFVENKNIAPSSYDWRTRNIVTPVEDQGSCGSFWAFSTLGNLESIYAINKGTLKVFSKQMLVDCDISDSGCNGGLMEYAYSWIRKNGIMFDLDYPYIGTKSYCKSNKSKYVDMAVTGYLKLGNSYSTFSCADEDEMKEFLFGTNPLAAALNASPLQTYTSGVLDATSAQCPADGINHAVLIVGYGTDPSVGLDYWIVKNSWGKNWGENGYFRIRRGNGTCGINCYVITGKVSF